MSSSVQEDRYREAAAEYGAPLGRLARAYEADPDRRRDLLQEIHLALWRSLEQFDGRCSLRTWTYRVAHNTAASYVLRERRSRVSGWVSLEEAEAASDGEELAASRRHSLDRLLALMQSLKPLDRQLILSYLEGMDAAEIAEISGISPGNVATKIHRIKNLLARKFQEGVRHAE